MALKCRPKARQLSRAVSTALGPLSGPLLLARSPAAQSNTNLNPNPNPKSQTDSLLITLYMSLSPAASRRTRKADNSLPRAALFQDARPQRHRFTAFSRSLARSLIPRRPQSCRAGSLSTVRMLPECQLCARNAPAPFPCTRLPSLAGRPYALVGHALHSIKVSPLAPIITELFLVPRRQFSLLQAAPCTQLAAPCQSVHTRHKLTRLARRLHSLSLGYLCGTITQKAAPVE